MFKELLKLWKQKDLSSQAFEESIEMLGRAKLVNTLRMFLRRIN